jgi:predicted dehydrogenase
MDFVKFGVIGTGSAWGFHSAGCKGNPKIQFTGVFDVNEKVAQKVASRNQATNMIAYSSVDDLLASDIDAVLIAIPHYLHEELVIKAAEAGKHVLCEKPMATTLEACDAMIEATQMAGVKFMIAENHRFIPAHVYIHDCIQRGLIGKVYQVRAYEGVNEYKGLMQPGFWKGDPIKAGGGSLMDMGAHKFASIQWMLNDSVESIYSWITKQCTTLDEKAEDNAMAMVKFQSGAIGDIAVSFTISSPPTNSLEIFGTKGTILENHMWEKPVKIYSSHEDMKEKRLEWIEPEIEHGVFPLYYNISARLEDDYFATCILEDRMPEFTPQMARDAIKVVLMGYLSAETNQIVNVDDLMKIYSSKGTKSILEDMLAAVQKNY